ncbi:NRAMP family divalent metal transporter [Georgenia ruanii]|uniref:Divalent metal cation transporter n=1 Tax=Georgenia ruanii TaxID=348442 RepID=A0A7J9UZU0_9MICO|nr:NRAMP family divalent metal transporter [Georgenia ruanii]MPV90161.1 hypothetical protein [Georgenia ruanii]
MAQPADAPARISRTHRTGLLGAMFLMATSAIGPGFITQTANFTVELGAAFAFAILASVVVDICVQLNVWRVIGITGLRANELGNRVLPGVGVVLAVLVFAGGLVFNIGNTAGGGLGINATTGLNTTAGGVITAVIAIAVFLSRRAGIAMDRIVVVLGALMILLTLYVAIESGPPVGEALKNMVAPERVDFFVITTLIGGTVGGYITYAGAHRMIDAGVRGPDSVRYISRSSVMGVIITGLMRFLLFLAIFGVVAGGAKLVGENIAAQAFGVAAGELGMRLFGVVLWAASITSVIGAAYTSITFVTKPTASPRTRSLLTCLFIAVSAVVFVVVGQAPSALLIFAGAFNGLILPIGFAVILWVAWRRRDLLRGYRYPRWLLVLGVLAWLLTLYFGYNSFAGISALWT